LTKIVEPILFQCKLNPLTPAICVPGSAIGSITYARLEAIIHNIARTALHSGIGPGTIAATFINDAALHIAFTLGLMHAGATTLSLRGPKPVAGITPDVVLTDNRAIFRDTTVVSMDVAWLEGDGAAAPVVAQGSGDDICRIILTSGSTGVAKGVAFSHRVTAARNAHYMYSKGPRPARCTRFFCDLGISTSPGFSYTISILSRGGTVFFLGLDPVDILQVIDLHQIEGMATSPYGLSQFLRFFEADSAFETCFDHIICQGAAMSPQLSQRARARMCQNLYSSYGSTETSTVAFGPASLLERIPGAVGFVQPGVTIEAVNQSDEVMPPLQDGVLRIRNEHMGEGYVGDPEASKSAFRDGYFYTGDIGHLTAEGILVITGREKTALNIGGDTVSSESIEDALMAFPGIRDAAVFAANNDLGVAELTLLVVAGSPIDATAIRQYCAQRLPASCIPTQIFQVDGLPRGGQGKLERQRLPEIASKMRNLA
jgi:acyl-CoA synthetase (AMP-forming)/AMP-acid ligase II